MVAAKNDISADEVRELLDYDPSTGVFTWRKKPCRRVNAGAVAGCEFQKTNRWRIQINGRVYLRARLAWLWVKGEWPPHQIDHRDTDEGNDRFDNLRPATHAENQQNKDVDRRNSSGHKGVYFDGERWRWQVRKEGKSRRGSSKESDVAIMECKRAALELHGEFARSY